MNKTIRQILQIKNAVGANTLIYYLTRLPLIGKHIPESLYADAALKNVLAGLVQALVQIGRLFTKALYVLALVWAPIYLMIEDVPASVAVPLFIHILFFLSCILGPFQDSVIFKVTREKFLCLKYMKMNVRTYTLAGLLIHYLPHFVWFLPVILVFLLLMQGTVYQALCLWLLLIAYRLAGEAFSLWVYGKSGKVFVRNYPLVWGIIGVGLAGAYYPLFAGEDIAFVLTSVPFLLLSLGLGALSLYYILRGYKGYERGFIRSVDEKFLFSVQVQQSKHSAFADVAVKESDLAEAGDKAVRTNAVYARLKGFSYLNAIFFSRHRRQLLKPVFIRIAIVALVFLAGAALWLIAPERARELGGKIPATLPALVFIMYFANIAEKACRAMFYNCDISLLRYGFYRQARTIINNFQVRLGRICGYNLLIGLAICAAAIGFRLLCGMPWMTLDMGMFVATILLLCVFFSVHHLFLYYVFQPYTTELNVKNPFFKVINTVVYLLCFVCLRIDTGGTIFTLGVLGFTIVYSITALILVYRFAPATFRVK